MSSSYCTFHLHLRIQVQLCAFYMQQYLIIVMSGLQARVSGSRNRIERPRTSMAPRCSSHSQQLLITAQQAAVSHLQINLQVHLLTQLWQVLQVMMQIRRKMVPHQQQQGVIQQCMQHNMQQHRVMLNCAKRWSRSSEILPQRRRM